MTVQKFTNSDVADVLDKAADILESDQVEWCQHREVGYKFIDEFNVKALAIGSVCAQGALGLAVGMEYLYAYNNGRQISRAPLAVAAEVHVNQRLYDELPLWNDHPERKRQDVIDLFKETAKDLRNGPVS